MDVSKYEINFSRWIGYLTRFDILVNTRKTFYITTHPCIILYILNVICGLVTFPTYAF